MGAMPRSRDAWAAAAAWLCAWWAAPAAESGQDDCAAAPVAAASAGTCKAGLARGPGTDSAAAKRIVSLLLARRRIPAMPVRAAIVALLAVGGAAQAQSCAGTPTGALVLDEALPAPRAVEDEGARAQALSQIAFIEAGAGRLDDGLRLAESI